MNWWERFDLWLFTKYDMTPLGLVARIFVAFLALWAIAWALGTIDDISR